MGVFMKSFILRMSVLAMIAGVSIQAQAEGITESQLLLQQAMMDSNADYNKHKKKNMDEEDERADSWEERKLQAIDLDGRPGRSREVSSAYSDDQVIKD